MEEDKELKLPFTCVVCKKGFNTAYGLKIHSKTHEGQDGITYFCPKCDQKFTRKCDGDAHFATAHSDETLPPPKKRKRPDGGKRYTPSSSMYQHPDRENEDTILDRIKRGGKLDIPSSSLELQSPKRGKTLSSTQQLKCQPTGYENANSETGRISGNETPKSSEQSTSPPALQNNSSLDFFADRNVTERGEFPRQSTIAPLYTPQNFPDPQRTSAFRPTGFTPSFPWYNNAALGREIGLNGNQNDALPRGLGLSFLEQGQNAQAPLQVQGIVENWVARNQQYFQPPTLMNPTGSMGMNIDNNAISEHHSMLTAFANDPNVSWDIVFYAFQMASTETYQKMIQNRNR